MSPARAELLRSESRSCCTDVDVTSGGLIPCAGHGKFRSETASSEVEEHHGLNLVVEQPARADINQSSGKPVRRHKPSCVCPVDLS